MKKYIITAFLAVGIFVTCIIPAHAASAGSVVSLVKDMFGVCLETVNQGEDAWIAARDQINSHWQSYSSVSSMARLYLSYETMSNLAAELNGDGFPCRLEFNRNLQLYVICGVGEVGSVPGVYVTGLYLTNGSRDLFCCEYNTDSLLSNISSNISIISTRLDWNFSSFVSHLDEKLAPLSSISSTLTSFHDNFLTRLDWNFSTFVSHFDEKIDPLSNSVTIGVGLLNSINNKLDNLGSSSGSSDNSDVVAAVNGVSDLLEKLFGEYHSTYAFPSLRDKTIPSPADALYVGGVDAYSLDFIPEGTSNNSIWYIPTFGVTLRTKSFTSSGGLYSGHKATISNPMGSCGFFWYEYKETFSVSNTSNLPSTVYRDFSFIDLGGNNIELANFPCSLSYTSSGTVTISVLLAPGQFADGSYYFTTNRLQNIPYGGKLCVPQKVRPEITRSGRWFIYSDYSDPVSVYFPAYFNSFLEKQFNRVVDLLGSSGGSSDLISVTTRLDTIIEQLQTTSGESGCDHTYTQDVTQAPTCILPGLQVSTCSQCGDSYSEILAALGHDWQCTSHVEAVTDPDTGEVTQSGYDIYTCSRCGDTYNDYAGDGAPSDYGDTSLSKIIVKLFSKLGTFAGKVISWIIGLFDKMLSGLNDLITRFSDLTAQITGFGGDYPSWLSGFWGILPQEFQLALTFSFVCVFIGVIGRKLFFV